MPFSVHSTLEKHMRKCVVTNSYSQQNLALNGTQASTIITPVATNYRRCIFKFKLKKNFNFY